MTFDEVNGLYAMIQRMTYVCLDCHRIIWPTFSLGDNGDIMVSVEARPVFCGHRYFPYAKVCPECEAKRKSQLHK